jgi:sulfur carrier protein ThiS
MRIKVMKLGQSIREVEVPAGTTIQGVLEVAGLQHAGMTVSRNGINATLGAEVSGEDTVLLSPKVVGGCVAN